MLLQRWGWPSALLLHRKQQPPGRASQPAVSAKSTSSVYCSSFTFLQTCSMMLWLLLRGVLHQPQLTMGHNIPQGLLPLLQLQVLHVLQLPPQSSLLLLLLQLGLPVLLPSPWLLLQVLHVLPLPLQSLPLHSGLPLLLLPSLPPMLHIGLQLLLPSLPSWLDPLSTPKQLSELRPPPPPLLLLLHPSALPMQQARGSLYTGPNFVWC